MTSDVGGHERKGRLRPSSQRFRATPQRLRRRRSPMPEDASGNDERSASFMPLAAPSADGHATPRTRLLLLGMQNRRSLSQHGPERLRVQ